MTVMYGVFDKEESMYILYANDFFDADLFVKERGLGNRLEIDMIDLKINGKEVIRRRVEEEDFMTEKRFTYDKPMVAFSKGGINDNVTGKSYEFTMDTVLDLLNELHEEKTRLYEDNIRIKQLITTAFNNERTELGSNVLKQLIEQL